MTNSTTFPELIVAHAQSENETHYDIKGILGEGGSGITYQAEILGTERQVAVKELSLQKSTDWKAIELFEREAQILSKLQHPAIPKYIDYYVIDSDDDRNFYIVQELAPGKTLAAWLQEGWRCNEAAVKNIAVQMLEILVYLHKQHPPVVHRDIKPSNILRTATGQISLVDFGAVQQTYHNTFLRGSTVVGTYGYMAPEQFRGQAVPATDLYGLGATILTLLTNRSPAELSQDGLKISFRNNIQVSTGFADWLEKMLEPDKADRFTSANAALAALQSISTKQSPKKSKHSDKERSWIITVSILFLITVNIVNNYKYHLLSAIGVVPSEVFKLTGQDNKLREYLDRGVNPNVRDENDLSMLYHAVLNNHLNTAKMLLSRGADVKARHGRDGHTVLHIAVLHDDGEMTKLLLDNKADPNVRDSLSYTPLHIAMLAGSYPYMEKYLGEFYRVKAPSMSVSSIEYLLKAGAHVNPLTSFSDLKILRGRPLAKACHGCKIEYIPNDHLRGFNAYFHGTPLDLIRIEPDNIYYTRSRKYTQSYNVDYEKRVVLSKSSIVSKLLGKSGARYSECNEKGDCKLN